MSLLALVPGTGSMITLEKGVTSAPSEAIHEWQIGKPPVADLNRAHRGGSGDEREAPRKGHVSAPWTLSSLLPSGVTRGGTAADYIWVPLKTTASVSQSP